MKKSQLKISAAPGGERKSKSEQPQALQVVAPGTLSEDALMGQQLTDQYQKAVGGMTEVLKFGAMMMALRKHIESTRGLDHATTTGRGAKYDAGTGVTAWLKDFAPEIKKATAYRFLHVAEAVAERFQLPGKISFVELATRSADDLPAKLQKKQLKLWEFVNGTSRKSWLDMFKPEGRRGGHHPRQGPPKTAEEMHAEVVKQWRVEILQHADRCEQFLSEGHHKLLNDAELDHVADNLERHLTAIRAWRKMTKAQRQAEAFELLRIS